MRTEANRQKQAGGVSAPSPDLIPSTVAESGSQASAEPVAVAAPPAPANVTAASAAATATAASTQKKAAAAAPSGDEVMTFDDDGDSSFDF